MSYGTVYRSTLIPLVLLQGVQHHWCVAKCCKIPLGHPVCITGREVCIILPAQQGSLATAINQVSASQYMDVVMMDEDVLGQREGAWKRPTQVGRLD